MLLSIVTRPRVHGGKDSRTNPPEPCGTIDSSRQGSLAAPYASLQFPRHVAPLVISSCSDGDRTPQAPHHAAGDAVSARGSAGANNRNLTCPADQPSSDVPAYQPVVWKAVQELVSMDRTETARLDDSEGDRSTSARWGSEGPAGINDRRASGGGSGGAAPAAPLNARTTPPQHRVWMQTAGFDAGPREELL